MQLALYKKVNILYCIIYYIYKIVKLLNVMGFQVGFTQTEEKTYKFQSLCLHIQSKGREEVALSQDAVFTTH